MLSQANCQTWPKDQDGTINTSSRDRSFYIICENDSPKNENDECQLRHWNPKNRREDIYTSNEKFVLELGQLYTNRYNVEIIQDWYHDVKTGLYHDASYYFYSICKIKAVLNYQRDVQYSIDDTIHLDIITVGSKKKVRKDRPEKI